MQSEEQQELLQRSYFGKQVELFYESQVGGYLRTRAQELYTTALEQLKSCDPTDTRAVMKAQNSVRVAEWFEQWLGEAIVDGLKSLEILEGEDGNVD